MSTNPQTASDGRALVEYGAETSEAKIVSISRGNSSSAGLLILPEGKKAVGLKSYLDEYRTAPDRKEGTAKLSSIDSLIEHVNRFKDADSAVFAVEDRKAPSITAVLDYHKPGTGDPRFGKHRAHYAFPLSDEWNAWQAHNGQPMAQAEFAEFMEDRIADVLVPPANLQEFEGAEIKEQSTGGDFGDRSPDEQLAYLAKLLNGRFAGPSTMMELSRGLAIHASEKVQNAVVLSTGEVNVQFVSEHADAQGNKVSVPNLFLIGIPVFRLGVLYRIAIRLRYRLPPGTGVIKWIYELYRHDVVFDDAFREACDKVKADTDLPLFYGTPEQA